MTVASQAYPSMLDAAYRTDLNNADGALIPAAAYAGYLNSPMAYHPWSAGDWASLSGKRKLPIWVAGMAGLPDAEEALDQLTALRVPVGSVIAVDMENRVDETYITNFFAVMFHAKYKVWVYGSASSVFSMPACNGYWVADYAGIGAFMYPHKTVRATQWTNGLFYDTSAIMAWVLRQLWQ